MLLTDRATKSQFLQDDSTFELQENAYQNICTELGIQNNFTGKAGAPNGKPDNYQEKNRFVLSRKEFWTAL